ncbi:GNAT family acetyltransferase [Novosphingobium terrae]|uniref:GNAT family acetyltransferase n=1 Tax=Novosphingobium terrae TaxID=2726189 RepID=UPI00197FA512|nr:GNAT family acetyltransferase [Novosphingobium terrae]
MELREALLQDSPAIAALWQACGLTRPWNDPLADIALALGNATSTILLAHDGETLIGTVMAGFEGHRGWIYYLATLPDRRGEGIAAQLLETAQDWLAQLGCPKVELMVREGNEAAGLYEHLGWDKQPVAVYARWLRKDV